MLRTHICQIYICLCNNKYSVNFLSCGTACLLNDKQLLINFPPANLGNCIIIGLLLLKLITVCF